MLNINDIKECETVANIACRLSGNDVFIGDSMKLNFFTTKKAYWDYRKDKSDIHFSVLENKIEYNSQKFFAGLSSIGVSFEETLKLWVAILASFIKDRSVLDMFVSDYNDSYRISYENKHGHQYITKKTHRGNGMAKYEVSYRKQIHASKDVYKTRVERLKKEKEVLKEIAYSYLKEIGYIDENNTRTIGAKKAYAALKDSFDMITDTKIPVCSISYELITDIFREYNVGKMTKLGRPSKKEVKVETVVNSVHNESLVETKEVLGTEAPTVVPDTVSMVVEPSTQESVVVADTTAPAAEEIESSKIEVKEEEWSDVVLPSDEEEPEEEEEVEEIVVKPSNDSYMEKKDPRLSNNQPYVSRSRSSKILLRNRTAAKPKEVINPKEVMEFLKSQCKDQYVLSEARKLYDICGNEKEFLGEVTFNEDIMKSYRAFLAA